MSAADGTFTFDNVPPGTYHLSVRRAGLLDATDRSHGRRRRRADRPAGRSRSALRGGRVGQRRRAQPVRDVPADLGARRPGAVEAARDVAWRDAREPAGRRGAQLRAGAGAAGHSRARRRSRADPAGRPAHGRPVEPVRRSRRARSIPPRRSGSRSCAVRPRCSTAPTRLAAWSTSSPTTFRPSRIDGRQRQPHVRSRVGGQAKAARPATCTSATAPSRFTPAAAAAARATSSTPEGDVVNSQSRSGFGSVGLSWTGAKSVLRRQLRLRRHEVRHSGRRGRPGPADAAAARVLVCAAVRTGPRRCVRFVSARRSPSAATSTTSWRRTKSAPPSRTTPPRSR